MRGENARMVRYRDRRASESGLTLFRTRAGGRMKGLCCVGATAWNGFSLANLHLNCNFVIASCKSSELLSV